MLEQYRLLPILDMLAHAASEFTHVSSEALDMESALQAQDGNNPSQWQVICTISAFINFLAEKNRMRYGHFAFDIDPKNNESKKKDAKCTLDRMKLFFESENEEINEERKKIVERFLDNECKIKEHLKAQPDVYAPNIPQEEHREWMIKLRVLGEQEKEIIKEWNEIEDGKQDKSSNN